MTRTAILRWVGILLSAFLAAACSSTNSPSSSGASSTSTTAGATANVHALAIAAQASISTIVTQFSGSCVGIDGASASLGAGIVESSCGGTTAESFKITATGDGYYSIQPENDSLCLDAGTGSTTTAVQITQNACSGALSQKWDIKSNGDGSYTISTPDRAGCMDVYAGRTADGTIVTTYACHAASNEQFVMSGYSAVAATTTEAAIASTIVTQFSGSCVDIAAASTQSGAGLDESGCTGATNQRFTFSATSDGFYTIQPQNDGLCLDSGSGSLTTGIQIEQNTCSGTTSQKWNIASNGDGSYSVKTFDGSGCMDVYAGRTANGTIVTTYACHSASNESFLMSGFGVASGPGTATTVTTAPATTPTTPDPAPAAVAPAPASSSATTSTAASGGSYTSALVAKFSGSCVVVTGGSTQAGAGTDESQCTPDANQNFRFTAIAGGFYVIQPSSDNLCLDAGSGSETTGVQITQRACSGATSQQWKIVSNSDGSYSITTADGNGCMDVYAGRVANGTIVTTYACHSSNNEEFVAAGLAAAASAPGAVNVPTQTPAPVTTPVQAVPSYPGLAVPIAGTDPSAPRIFNASSAAQPGDIISIQGTHFDSMSQVWLAGTTLASATKLAVVDSVGTTQLSVQVPASATGGLMAWVSNTYGASNSVKLNGAVPLHLDALQLVPGGAFRVLGRNLLISGSTPTVTVDGKIGAINTRASNANLLVVTAPLSLNPTSAAVILVDNGNGTGAARLDRPITVVSGSGDPLGLGVGWAAGFSFANRLITVTTPCDGNHDDSGNIQSAINTAANGGGVVQIPAGVCILANTLTMNSHVILKGAGKDVTFLKYQSNYPIYAQSFDFVGLQDFTLVNSGSAQEGVIWKQNTRSFFQRIKIDMGVSRQFYLTGNQNMVVSQTDFIQRGSIGGQNPYLFNDSSGFLFSENTTTSIDGSPTFQSVHDALFLGNHFTRDASNQNESPVIATHRFVMDFAYRISLISNTLDVVNGPVTNTTRNDGETFLTEGGGSNRTENMGTVSSATSTTITDVNNAINVNPFGNGLPENYGIAIVAGTGAGQTREVVGYAGNTLSVDHAWDVLPDSNSHYATFVWGLEKSVISGNSLVGNPRGIWLYQTAVREVDILNNTISNGGGVFLRTYQSQSAKQFDPMYNVRIVGNTIANSDGLWMSYVDVVFVNKDPTAFGTADTGIEIRNNTLTANNPNLGSSTEDYASREGFMNLMRSEPPTGQLSATPAILGTIFQSDACSSCNVPFIIGTGAYGTVFSNDQSGASSANFLTDWQTLGSSVAGSIGTVIH